MATPKKKTGLATLIGKPISLLSRYDDHPVQGTLKNIDSGFIEFQDKEGECWWFNTTIIRCIKEELSA